MPATPLHALPYPAPGDPDDVPTDMSELALAIDPLLGLPVPSTSPPDSPADGQLWIYPAAAGITWLFRYNAASPSPYKWEFLGGPPLFGEATAGTGGVVSTSYVSIDPNLTVPRAGDYDWRLVALVSPSDGGVAAYCGVQLGAAAASDSDAFHTYFGSAAVTPTVVLTKARRAPGLAAGAIVRMVGKVSSGNCNYQARSLAITPVRIS